MATIVNNVAYSWAMIELTAPALTGSNNANPTILQGVSGIKWNIKRNVKTNYGLGGEPVNRGFGNREYTASITMDYLDEFADEIEEWVIEAIKKIGLDTAKAVLNAPREALIEKADLEEDTVDHVLEVLQAEFEDEDYDNEEE